MIECDLDGHKDIFYNTKAFAKHIISKHKNQKDFLKWAKRKLKQQNIMSEKK